MGSQIERTRASSEFNEERAPVMMEIVRHFQRKVRNITAGKRIPVQGVLAHGGCWSVASWILAGAVMALAVGVVEARSQSAPAPRVIPLGGQELQFPPPNEPISPQTPKQKQEFLKSNFEKMKRDADDLTTLAKSLQEELGKSNENVFSLKVVEKAEKIEKLAKKIKSVAKGQ